MMNEIITANGFISKMVFKNIIFVSVSPKTKYM